MGRRTNDASGRLMPKRKAPKRRRYYSDLTDTQWVLIEAMIPEAWTGGGPREATSREVVDAILYFLRAGTAWRLLPHDLPPWQTVYYYLRRRQGGGRLAAHPTCARARRSRTLRTRRVAVGAVLDSQSVRTADQKEARSAMTRVKR